MVENNIKLIPRVTSLSSAKGVAIPINSLVRGKCEVRPPEGATVDPTGSVDFILCRGDEIQKDGCTRGGTFINNAELERVYPEKFGDVSIRPRHGVPRVSGGKPSHVALSERVHVTDVGKYCWRCDYKGNDRYNSGSDTNTSMKTNCFHTTLNKALPFAGSRYKRIPETGPPIENVRDRLVELIKKRSRLNPKQVALHFGVAENVGRKWLSEIEMEGYSKHPRKDEYRYSPPSVEEIFREKDERERIRRIQLEEQRREKLRDAVEETDGSNISDEAELGIHIPKQCKWDATPRFARDVKKADDKLLNAAERKIARICDHPERGEHYGTKSGRIPDATISLINQQCPTKMALKMSVTADYRLIWCNVGEQVRLLRLISHGDPDYQLHHSER